MSVAIPHLSHILILGDVVNFSLLDRNQQVPIVENLWEFIEKSSFLKGKNIHLNGTGDGILLGIEDTDTACGETLEFARSWVDYMKTQEPKCSLRVALHIGHYTTVATQSCGVSLEQIVGKGPNDVARLVDYAGEDNIIVSEDLFKTWSQIEGDSISKYFIPDPEYKDPFIACAKHNVPFSFRLHNTNGDIMLPPRLQLFSAAEEYIYGHLKEISDHVINLIEKKDPSLTYERLKPRISIFVPRAKPNPKNLVCSNYRYQRESIHIAPSRTLHSFIEDEDRQVQIPLGRAFIDYQPYFIGIKESHYKTNYEAYCNELSSSMKIPITRVRDFTRKPMAIMAIPFGFFKDKADGIICIDFDNNLASIAEDDIELIMEEILLCYDEIISYLWRLRT